MSEKEIYQCPVTARYYDPLAVKRQIVLSSRGKFNEAVADRSADDPVKRAEAEALLVAVARAALGLPAIDPKTGAGETDGRAVEALTAFTRWLKGKGLRARSSPGGAPCTDCPPGR